jgi:hypothetical protein
MIRRLGDLLLHYSEKKERVNHTQIVTYSSDDVVMINQGNFVSAPSMLIRNSGDPQKWGGLRYIGSKIERGVYNKETGNYIREGKKTEGLYKSNKVLGRSWNYSWSNWKKSVYNEIKNRK